MVTRSNIKFGITGALLAIIVGSFSACADLPTAESEPDRGNSCLWVDDILHCPPT